MTCTACQETSYKHELALLNALCWEQAADGWTGGACITQKWFESFPCPLLRCLCLVGSHFTALLLISVPPVQIMLCPLLSPGPSLVLPTCSFTPSHDCWSLSPSSIAISLLSSPGCLLAKMLLLHLVRLIPFQAVSILREGPMVTEAKTCC